MQIARLSLSDIAITVTNYIAVMVLAQVGIYLTSISFNFRG